jgi:hypothetical protein
MSIGNGHDNGAVISSQSDYCIKHPHLELPRLKVSNNTIMSIYSANIHE